LDLGPSRSPPWHCLEEQMGERTLTLGRLRELTRKLPDETVVCMSDWDGAHLHCYPEQAMLDGGHILFIPSSCYELWVAHWDEEETPYPIPEEWKEEEDDGT